MIVVIALLTFYPRCVLSLFITEIFCHQKIVKSIAYTIYYFVDSMQKILYNIEEIDTIMAARPKACYTHITSKPTATNWKTIDPGKPLHFDKYTTFGKKQLAITLSHKIHPTTQLTHNGMPIPATLDNATVQNHNVRLARNDVHFSIVEHIMGILTATNHAIHITTE